MGFNQQDISLYIYIVIEPVTDIKMVLSDNYPETG